jgi:hypothetical protein
MAGELAAATPDAFYRRVNATLEKMDFARQVWAICEPAYADASRGGRPGIDPVVYLKMLTVGFFEDLPSERAIASRSDTSTANQVNLIVVPEPGAAVSLLGGLGLLLGLRRRRA